jgi:Fe-S-cluster-containing dehydrogenase component
MQRVCAGVHGMRHAKGYAMIQLDYIDHASSPQTVPVVCMHCQSPTCAEVCPADAIKRTSDGVVQTARKPRCIACNNCVLACPFGVPKMHTEMRLMMKCDMCYDRTFVGKKPMCASVCPSQALYFGTRTEIEQLRPNSRPINTFSFGAQMITTKVNMLVPKQAAATHLDVIAALHESTIGNSIENDLLLASMEVTHEP